nr:hypothetical protein [Chryseolinea sp.]
MNTIKIIPLLFIIIISCTPKEKSSQLYTAYTGATIIDGNGGDPIQNGVLLIYNGKIISVGSKEAVTIPENTTIIDVSGKTIIPGLINTHGHVGNVKGIDGGNYSAENIIDNLSIYASYGITTVISLGGDGKESVSLRAV